MMQFENKLFLVGYMDKDLFKSWFKDLFLPNCGRERPIILLLDNHDSHYSYDVLQMAKENEVILI